LTFKNKNPKKIPTASKNSEKILRDGNEGMIA
jgi:hypothetical protein